ncbi:hypothetical protein like AT3G06240 [Hibiscus trionum]|uniref:F-box associated beta-propeller type 3 domain-containing protein n=1 Tax=Hibiscus trionum TaxID=183268 RepID=A0A9W7IJZ0_HIBTR|nr:hypothetical protein like AT3G06240 [Hibiscus trionum]
MASIPSPLIYDILIRLPVKSVARFKALNKLCCSFIRDPHFINTHLKSCAAKEGDNDVCLIVSCMEHRNLHSTIHFFTVRNEHAVVEYSPPVSLDSYKVLPSCNGLVCFYGLHGGVYVCNTSTKDMVKLPDIDAQGFRFLSCGFGFDESSGKHKVIKILDPPSLGIGIFSMGNGSWRKIRYHIPSFDFLHHQPPVFAGGFFYWFSTTFSIVSLDIGNETFEAIAPPKSVSDKDQCKLYLVELRGELCLVDFDFELDQVSKRMDIWVLKKELWVKLGTVLHPSEPIHTTRPVGFKCNEILLHGFIKGVGHLSCYNLETGGFRPLEIQGIPSQYYHLTHHVESLFPVGH